MRTKVQKWGNSLAVRIPKAFAEELGVRPDSEIELTLDDHELTLRPTAPHYSLADLLDGITDSNVHDEVATGEPVGIEAW